MKFEEFIEDIKRKTKVRERTITYYKIYLRYYTEFHQMSLEELLDEAEQEEDDRIRMRKRKINSRLMDFYDYLSNTKYHKIKDGEDKKYKESTIIAIMTKVTSFYRIYQIEIPQIKQRKDDKSETLEDLPTLQELKQAVQNTSSIRYRALFLMMISSGMALNEVTHLTCKDLVDGVNAEGYEFKTIQELIKFISETKKSIIPTFHIKRIKTNYYYYCFCSPEALNEVVKYLQQEKDLNNDRKIFLMSRSSIFKQFERVNKRENFGKVNGVNKFHSHALRKFFATALMGSMKMDSLIIQWLLGHKVDSTTAAYFKANPKQLKKAYMKVVDNVSINKVKVITYTDKDIQKLADEQNKIKKNIKDLMKLYD